MTVSKFVLGRATHGRTKRKALVPRWLGSSPGCFRSSGVVIRRVVGGCQVVLSRPCGEGFCVIVDAADPW